MVMDPHLHLSWLLIAILNVNGTRTLGEIRAKPAKQFALRSLTLYIRRQQITWYMKQVIPSLNIVSYDNTASCRLTHCYKVVTEPSSSSSFWRAWETRSCTVMGPRPCVFRFVAPHPSQGRQSSVVKLSKISCRPNLTQRMPTPQILYNMRFSCHWLASVAKHQDLERICNWPANQYMWSIHNGDHKSFFHCSCRRALPTAILYSLKRFRSHLVNHRVCHANRHMALKMLHHLQRTSTQRCLQQVLTPCLPYRQSHLLRLPTPWSTWVALLQHTQVRSSPFW